MARWIAREPSVPEYVFVMDAPPAFARGPMMRALSLSIPLFVLLASLLASTPAPAQQRREGQRLPATVDRPDIIFRNHCSVCHGEKGDGQSFARHAFVPPPADFTSQKLRETLSRAHMIETVKKGARTKEGGPTVMIAWTSRLTDRHIEAVVDYIIVTFMEGRHAPDSATQHGHEHHGHDHSHVKQVDYPYGLKPDAARGKPLYATLCAKCHGERGDGQGQESPGNAGKPRNFHDPDFREFANGFTLYSAISRGNEHMPQWDKIIARRDIADVAEYVLKTFVKPSGITGRGK